MFQTSDSILRSLHGANNNQNIPLPSVQAAIQKMGGYPPAFENNFLSVYLQADKNLSDISLPDSHGLPFRFSPLDNHGLYQNNENQIP